MRLFLSLGFALTCLVSQLSANEFMSVIGDATFLRGNQNYKAAKRVTLKNGDVVSTNSGSVSFTPNGDVYVYAAPHTKLKLSENGVIDLQKGQIRLVSRRNSSTPVRTPDGTAMLNGGVHLVEVSQHGCRFACEAVPCQVYCAPSQQRAIPLQPGQDCIVIDGQLLPVNPQVVNPWEIPTQALQQQALNESQVEFQQAQQSQPRSNVPSQGQQPPTEAQQFAQQGQGANQRRSADIASIQASANGSINSTVSVLAATAGNSGSGGRDTNFGQSGGAADTVRFNPTNDFKIGTAFRGEINIVTNDRPYALSGLELTAADLASFQQNGDSYYSIGAGDQPDLQPSSSFNLGPARVADTISIPGYDNNYLIKLEGRSGNLSDIDPAFNNAATNANDPIQEFAVNGLMSPSTVENAGERNDRSTLPSLPVPNLNNEPTISNGIEVLNDERASLNPLLTSIAGEFRVGENNGEIEFGVRQSDQDRRLQFTNNINDPNDTPESRPLDVTLNPEVEYETVDPDNSGNFVETPVFGSYNPGGNNFGQLSRLRRAAATVSLADSLYDIANRTRQTRFVIDGRIVDITGYRK